MLRKQISGNFVALLVGVILVPVSLWAQSGPFTVGIRDACDPPTFNAVIGPGTCLFGDHGRTKFNVFAKEVQQDRMAGAWYFSPLLNASTGTFHIVIVNLNSGRATSLMNTGGETHTFTRVAKFGGGFVQFLNDLTGNHTPAPECLQPENSSNIFVEAGTTEVGPVAGSADLPTGTSRWQCCVHPWMRMTIKVK
ncbi:MAG TPA: hypothetical protein VFI95_08255 [Terriglobales bacterium]|nr:hypothetical protein [Terriglobales bacterium]